MRRLAVLMPIAIAACTHTAHFDTATPDAPAGYPPPAHDLMPPIGSSDTLEIATWNIENFPATPHTAALVADAITSLDLDIVVCEEIASQSAWDELLARLPDHDGILSTHQYTATSYQKIGVIYRSSLVTVGAPTLLFDHDGYAFPRPPLALPITVDGEPIELIGVHLKAGVNPEDAARRREAVATLDGFLRAQVDGGGPAKVVVLGDYNERVVEAADRDVLAPLLTAPDRYTVRTEPLALAGETSFLNFGGSFIDHITTTSALDAEWAAARVVVPPVPEAVPGYLDTVSDHLPVVLITPRRLPPPIQP